MAGEEVQAIAPGPSSVQNVALRCLIHHPIFQALNTMAKNPLSSLSLKVVHKQYLLRKKIGEELNSLLCNGKANDFAQLALGISNPIGNYSASEHDLGPQILQKTPSASIKDLAKTILLCTTATDMLDTIYQSNIPFLKVGVGSEMSMLLKPKAFWVANTRTVWAHLLLKHKFNYKVANEALNLYRQGDLSSEMTYKIWKAIYLEMGSSVVGLTALASEEASKQNVKVGKQTNLWFDSIANALYEKQQ